MWSPLELLRRKDPSVASAPEYRDVIYPYAPRVSLMVVTSSNEYLRGLMLSPLIIAVLKMFSSLTSAALP